MKRYEFLEHTADAKFRAYGENVEEVFKNSAYACFSIIANPKKITCEKTFNVEVKAESLEALLYDYLDELLFLLDTEGFLLSEVEKISIEQGKNNKLKAVVKGDNYKNYQTSGYVKAVTYSEMLLENSDKGWMAQVVVDL